MSTFITAFQQGFDILSAYSIPLLSLFAGFFWALSILPLMADPIANGMRIFGHVAAMLLTIGAYIITLSNLNEIGNAIFSTFAHWGGAIGGFSGDDIMHPSNIMDLGFLTADPIRRYITSFTGLAAVKNAPLLIMYGIVFLGILASYLWLTKDIIVVAIEQQMALMSAAIFIPFGLSPIGSELAGFGIGWLVGVSVRSFLIAAILGVAQPLFSNLSPNLTAGGDPTLYSGFIMLFVAGIFAYLANFIPRRAELIAGRGMALALPGASLIPPGIGGGVRGTVNALRNRRRG